MKAGLLGSSPVANHFHIEVKLNLPHLSVYDFSSSWKSFNSSPASSKLKYTVGFSAQGQLEFSKIS